MSLESLSVRNIRGRYPCPGILKSENLIANVHSFGELVVIRIDDEEHPDAWFEITLELHGEALNDHEDCTASIVNRSCFHSQGRNA